MRKLQEFTIGDCKYKVQALGAFEALRVMHIAGPAIGAAYEQVQETGDDVAAIGAVIGHVKYDDLVQILRSFGACTEYQTAETQASGVWVKLEPQLDSHFSGARLNDMMQWATQCFQLNFSDFLDGLRALVKEKDPAAAEPESLQT